MITEGEEEIEGREKQESVLGHALGRRRIVNQSGMALQGDFVVSDWVGRL